MSPFLYLSLFIWAAIGFFYHRYQNGPKQPIGGPISWQKAWWLMLTTYSYFPLPLFVYFMSNIAVWQSVAAVVLTCWLGRGLLQSAFLFLWKGWIPPYGMAMNLLFSLVISWYYFSKMDGNFELPQVVFALHIIGHMLTDTLFAWLFFRKVGHQTKGAAAIWYAAQTAEFRKINQLTLVANLIFTTLLMYIVKNLS